MKAKQNTPSEYRNEAHYKQQVQEIILRNTKEDITIDLRDSSTIRLLGLSGSSIGSARLYPPSIKKGTLRGKFASSFTRLHSFSFKNGVTKQLSILSGLLSFPVIQKNPCRFHARRWKFNNGKWIAQRLIFQKDEPGTERSIPLDSRINTLLSIIESFPVKNRGYKIFRYLLENELKSGKECYGEFNLLLDNQDIYQHVPSIKSFPEFPDMLRDYLPKKTSLFSIKQPP